MSTTTTTHPAHHGRIAGFGRFVFHFFEMCIPMCIGWAVGDVLYFALADQLGSSNPFTDWPELSLMVVTVNMTAPMVAWMRFRGMAWRPSAEMASAMVILAVLILVAGWIGIVAMDTLPWLAHSLMMPAMLVPMLLRPDLYSGHAMGAHG
jgi:hypothetical protein